MKIEHSEGIVLSASTVNEADIITQMMTAAHGKGRYMFKGLKKSRRRHLSGASPGTLLNFSCYYSEHRQIQYINDFAVSLTPLQNPKSYAQVLAGHYILEAVDKTSAERDMQPFIFKLLKAALMQEGLHTFPYHLSLFFSYHLLSYHGILPFTGENRYDAITITDTSYSLSNSMRDFLRITEHEKFSSLECSSYPLDEVQQLLFMVIMYIEDYFHTELITKKVLFK